MMMRADVVERTLIEGSAGPIECLVEALSDGPRAASAVICHPHPLYGGSMDNKVVHTVSRALHRLGISTVRFNFRGVGQSGGNHDEGRGETDDALLVIDWMKERLPADALWLAGFSFGAWIALRAAARSDCQRLVTVAPPVQRFAIQDEPQPHCDWLVVQGAADELVDSAAVVEWINSLAPGPELVVLPGVDHFFHGALTELRDTLVNNLATAHSDAPTA